MTVYILQSLANPKRFYVGLTADLRTRLAAHNAGNSKYTAKWRPWKVVVSMWFAEESRARAFEAYLKSGSGRSFQRRHFEP
jgi:putative endonuclease